MQTTVSQVCHKDDQSCSEKSIQCIQTLTSVLDPLRKTFQQSKENNGL